MISADELLSLADFNASWVSLKVSSCFLRASAFLSALALSASATAVNSSIFSARSSALSWAFSDAGRAASSFSALSILAFRSSGRASVFPSFPAVAPASAFLAWSLFLNFFSVSLLASAFSLSSANSLRTSPAFKSPDSIAFNNPSLSTNSLAAFLAASLSVIFGSFAIDSSNWSKAFDKASLESASSFLASSSFLAFL